mgnify:FL=1
MVEADTLLPHTTHIQVADPFGIFTVGFVTLLWFRVLRMCQRDPAGLLKNVEHGYPVLPCGFHTDVRTGVLREPSS